MYTLLSTIDSEAFEDITSSRLLLFQLLQQSCHALGRQGPQRHAQEILPATARTSLQLHTLTWSESGFIQCPIKIQITI